MTAIVLPDVDRSTIDELRKRMPDLTEIELPSVALPSIEMPSFQKLGRSADERVDRIRGRSRTPNMPTWTWIAVGLGLVAIVGGIAALMTWNRRSSWSTTTSDPWTEDALGSMGGSTYGSGGLTGEGVTGIAEVTEVTGTTTDLGTGSGGMSGDDTSGLGLTAAEASLLSSDPAEDRGY